MKHIKASINDHQDSFPIAIIVSQFNQDLTSSLLKGTVHRLLDRGILKEDVLVIEVPGAVEIPFLAQRVALQKQHHVIIALGAVIRGETSHYDSVCQLVSEGCQRVSLSFNIPVIFGVLTTENDAQAWDRLGGRHGHKGADAADCAIAMHETLKQLSGGKHD
ncbi:MAG: 6,7-dimethyl-8-ribityllumazine synthase [Legionellales bacterium]|nr:6,7-dimethyl-8-ribityllumazine synthase [Legionellales bacterium]